jgi:hypothetical protein
MANDNRTGIGLTVTFDDCRRLRREAILENKSLSEYIRAKLGCKTLKEMQFDESLAKAFRQRVKMQKTKIREN